MFKPCFIVGFEIKEIIKEWRGNCLCIFESMCSALVPCTPRFQSLERQPCTPALIDLPTSVLVAYSLSHASHGMSALPTKTQCFFIYKSHITVLEKHKSGDVLHFRIWTKISCKLCILYKRLAAADRTSLILSKSIKILWIYFEPKWILS